MEEQTVIKDVVETAEPSVKEAPVSGLPNPKSQKLFIPILAVVLVLLIVSAIAWFISAKSTMPQQPQQQPKKMYPGKVTIDYFVWPGYIGLIMAQKKGYFKQEGVDVALELYDYSIPTEDKRNPY